MAGTRDVPGRRIGNFDLRLGKERTLKDSQRVMVVDGLPETEEVLKAVLGPRGVSVSRCRSHTLARSLEDQDPPQLLVVHGGSGASAGDLGAASGWNSVPRVVIGAAELAGPADDAVPGILSHPFHYRELIQAIERLLAEPPANRRPADASRSAA